MKKDIYSLLLVCCSLLCAATGRAEAVNACNIVSHKDAEKAAGVKLAEANLTTYEEKFMQGVTLCHYESLDGKHYTRFVNIELCDSPSPAEAAQKYNDALSMINAPENITGVGEQAVWGGSIKRPRGGLNILHGHYYLEIKVNSGDDAADNRKESMALAKKALEKLR